MLAGAVNDAPFAGAVSDTVGLIFVPPPSHGPIYRHTSHSPLRVSGFSPCVHQRASYILLFNETRAPLVYVFAAVHTGSVQATQCSSRCDGDEAYTAVIQKIIRNTANHRRYAIRLAAGI